MRDHFPDFSWCLGLALTLFCSLPSGAAKPSSGAHFEPDTDSAGAALLQGSTWVGGGGNWKVWIKQLDDEERLNFIQRTTGLGIDPFAHRPDVPPAYHTFLLVLENQGSANLSFNPQSCWLKTNRNEVLLPQGLADLSFNYRVSGRELPVAYEKVQTALFEQAVSIAPGERASGLLIYDRVNVKTKRWNLGLRLTLPDGEPAAFNAPYRRTDLKRRPRKGSQG
jgi:hypothetical protein